jgi:hypothetical protein
MLDALSGSLVAARVEDRVADEVIFEGKSPPRPRARFRGLTLILVIALVVVTLTGAMVTWLLPETPLERDARWAGAAAYLHRAISRWRSVGSPA